MAEFKVGYLVGSLATKSINRLLAKALVRVAPPELELTEISFKGLPLYSYDYDRNVDGGSIYPGPPMSARSFSFTSTDEPTRPRSASCFRSSSTVPFHSGTPAKYEALAMT